MYVTPDGHVWNILVNGVGSCDQQSNLLITLASLCEIPGQLVFLYGSSNISRHTVAELTVHGRNVMYDPFYRQIFLNESGLPAGIDEIISGNLKPLTPDTLRPDEYLDYFDESFPPVVYMNNKTGFKKRNFRNLVKIWDQLFAGILMRPYAELYWFVTSTPDTSKKRQRELFFN